MSTGTAVSLEQYLAHVYEPDCDFVDGEIEERNVGERTHARLQARITAYLLATYAASGVEVFTEIRIRVSQTRFRIPDVCATIGDPGEEVFTKPPFLCVEILSPEDRMSRLEVRIQDYLQMGVPYVWVLDPSTRQAYIATAAEGLREVKDGVLRASDPTLEMPLDGLWG
ncbi:MAG: Uma2 family endonuclease [Bryobacteraceae bacterium]